MPCRAVPCRAVPCRAVQCHAMPCLLCHPMLYLVVLYWSLKHFPRTLNDCGLHVFSNIGNSRCTVSFSCSRKRTHLLTNDERFKDSLFEAEMVWLTDGDVLFKGLVDEEPSIETAETIVDEDGAELWDCDVLELTDTFWLRLAVTLWDVGSDLLEYDGPLAVTDRETFTDALVENTLGLSDCETVLDALAVWIKPEKSLSKQDM